MKYLTILTLVLPLNAATTLAPATVGSISLESENEPPPTFPGERVFSGSVDFTPGAYSTGVTSTVTVGQAPNGATISTSQGNFSYGFFEFDITSLPENIHQATLNLTLPANGLAGSAPTSTQTIDIRLSDFDTSNFQSAYPDALPPDLLTGNIFAATQIMPSDAGSSIQFTFNEDGLNYLRSASSSSISTLKLIASIGTADYPRIKGQTLPPLDATAQTLPRMPFWEDATRVP
ncbi:hypothetical protein JO972_11720 [Verrucomicrobiaceae bacterium 5K15]|uniref:Uncharacterized protein n=1 Tax=Oceaniferula flava TaxID=2800421 RepID=A0AAE2VCG0_9BACT|nr:hypothetical protein [Oceaniferula flavus]MBK1855630.1 hypothetical protein [Oceaniferula flavus]MBM1136936.1 hypothetical protein [Oceaniferula flavus]